MIHQERARASEIVARTVVEAVLAAARHQEDGEGATHGRT